MGVDSGLPDFRGNQGMWRAYPELGKQRIDFTEIANPAAFKFQPNLAWGFYGRRFKSQVQHICSQLKKLGVFIESLDFFNSQLESTQ